MTDSPRLTVVMPTLNRPDILPATLSRLAAQDLPASEFEVVIVEDGCTDAARDTVEAARGDCPFELRFLQNPEGHRGPGYTQNKGIRDARAPLVLVLADDIFLVPGALRAHLDAHADHPGRQIAILGKALQSPELGNKNTFLEHWDPWGFSELEGIDELPWYMFWAFNISFKKGFVMEHGGFREHRGRAADGKGGGGAAHEDVELGYRLRQHGLRIFHCEAALGYHYHEYTFEQARRRYFERGVNWDEFRSFVPDPELVVRNHVLNRETIGEYREVLGGENSLRGRERSLAWHLFRHAVFRVVMNPLTMAVVWHPLCDAAERRPLAAALMGCELYRAILYYHFMRGVADARKRFGEPATPANA